MRCALALGAVLVAAAASSGSAATRSPVQVVRAWSKALDANHNVAAARLFAKGARVVQPGVDVRLRTRALAIGFNDSLPCAGRIVRLQVRGPQVTATFVLGTRPKHVCDGPGQKAAALFVVRKGKIVLWRQVPVPAAPLTA